MSYPVPDTPLPDHLLDALYQGTVEAVDRAAADHQTTDQRTDQEAA